jgi:hemerythrin-like metal-binding protein
MSSLVWSDALSVSMPVMDQTHQEFVDLLAAVELSDDAQLLAHWDRLIAHTEDHFGQEDAWMQATGFAPVNCHGTQHKVVLDVMREGAVLGRQGRLGDIRQMAHELGLWFPMHAQNMDASLALHLKSLGYDPATGQLPPTQALPEQAITGCGGACHTDERSDAATA